MSPGFALIAVLSLVLSVGTNTATFSFVNSIQEKSGSLTLNPIVFQIRDKQKVEAESGQLLVPEERKNPRARMIALAFIRFKSTAQKPAAPIVYLAGGPGDSGINDFRGMPLPLLNELRTIADVITLDQRGTGASEPHAMTCRYEHTLPLDRPGDPELFARIFRERMRECANTLQRRGVNLQAFTTEENADDVEALRVALGAKKLTLLTGSYGSHLGLSVIRRHRDSLERVISAGTEGLDQTFKLPSNVQANLEKLAALVRVDSFYSKSMPDLLQAIRTVMEQLERQPMLVEIKPEDKTVVVGKWVSAKENCRCDGQRNRNGPTSSCDLRHALRRLHNSRSVGLRLSSCYLTLGNVCHYGLCLFCFGGPIGTHPERGRKHNIGSDY